MKKVICLVLVVLVIATCLVGCNKMKVSTENLAMYSENTAITKGMMEYSFNVKYQMFLQSNSENLSVLGLNTEKSLSEQACSIDVDSATWYDYFLNVVKTQFNNYIVLNEYMLENGEDIGTKYLDRQDVIIKALEKTAKTEGKTLESLIKDIYGKNVTIDDIKEVTKLETVNDVYFEKFIKTLPSDDKAIKAYYDGHQKKYSTVDYLVFTVYPENTNDASKISNARKFADKLSGQLTKRNFLKLVGEYLEESYQKTEDLTQDELDKKVAKAKSECAVVGMPYDGSTIMRWAFDDSRKKGDGLVLETEDGGFLVYLLTKLPSLEDYNLVNFRQIQLEINDKTSSKKAKKKAEEILKTLKENNFSADSFITLAAANSSDLNTSQKGGLYENLIKGQLKNADKVEKWLFDDTRKVGDNTIIKTDEYGWHVLYIESIGDEYWKYASKSDYQNSEWNEHVTLLGDEYMIYSNNNVLNQIKEVSVQ